MDRQGRNQMELVIRNIRTRVASLLDTIQNGVHTTCDSVQYRLDSLCRDILQFREYIPNFEEVSVNLQLAKQVINRTLEDAEQD